MEEDGVDFPGSLIDESPAVHEIRNLFSFLGTEGPGRPWRRRGGFPSGGDVDVQPEGERIPFPKRIPLHIIPKSP